MRDYEVLGFGSEEERQRAIKAHQRKYKRKRKLEGSVQGLLVLGYEEEAYQHYVLGDLPLFMEERKINDI